MNTIAKSLASLLVGVLSFVVVGVGVTEALAPYIWPSALIGVPAGLLAGTISIPITYLGVTYWSERRKTGQASATTRRRLRTVVGASLGFIGGGGFAVALLSTQAVGIAAAMIFAGLPVGLLAAVVAGYLTFRRGPFNGRPPRSTLQ